MTEVTKPGNATRISKPKFLTLTNAPANRIAFKVVRSEGDELMAVPHISRKRVQRAEPLLQIAFEDGYTEEQAAAAIATYGLTGFEISTGDDGLVTARRTDAAEGTATVDIQLSEGRIATIVRPDLPVEANSGIEAVALRFDLEQFPEQSDVEDWCKAHSVDFAECAVENDDHSTLLRRAESVAGEDQRLVEVDTGVRFVLRRSEVTSVPAPYLAAVVDTAFGNYGWGHLDFLGAMADREFSNACDDAGYRLRNVMESILLHNSLPLATRKELVNRAAMQYADFIGALIDGLPTTVAIVHRSSEENTMTTPVVAKPAAPAAPAARTEDTPAVPAVVAAPVVEATALEAMRTDIAALAATVATLAQRGEPVAAPVVETPAASPELEALTAITRSMETMSKALSDVSEKVATMEGTTVVRSDDSDPAAPTPVKGVFNGILR